MKVQLCSLLLLFIFGGTLNGFPTGAPLSSCDNLLPQHNFSSRPLSNNTFRLFFGNVMSYNPGQNLEIILEGNLTFRGFLVESRSPEDINVGNFTPSAGQVLLSCSRGDVVTHANASLKSQVVLNYTYPLESFAYILFRFTVVRCFMSSPCDGTSEFWANIPGPIVSPNALVTISAGCGITKGCVGANFDGCTPCNNSIDCDIFVTWRMNFALDVVEFEIQSNIAGRDYAAIGLSLDQTMGMDDVFLCHRDSPGSVNFIITDAWNPNGQSNTEFDSNQEGIVLINSFSVDNTFYCRFARSIAAPDISRGYNISNQSILLASGQIPSSMRIFQHEVLPCTTPIINFAQVSLALVQLPNFSLLKAHGLFMILTWQILIEIGIFMARYTKPSFPNGEWYHTHRFVNGFAVICGIIGFILIFVYVGEWRMGGAVLTSHQIFGLSTIAILLLNPMIAIFRCKPSHRYRWVFNLLHGGLGLYAEFASLTTVFLGLWLFYTTLSNNSRPGFWLFVAWQISVFVLFDIPFITYRLFLLFSKTPQTPSKTHDISLKDQNVQTDNVKNDQHSETVFKILFHNIFSLPTIIPSDQRKKPAREWPIIVIGMSLFVAFNVLAYIIMVVLFIIAV